MKALFFLAASFLLSNQVSAQYATLDWAKSFGDLSLDVGRDIAVDNAGNTYISGRYNNTVDFDPGPDSMYLTVSGENIFVSKFDPYGNFIWAVSIGGPALDNVYSMIVDDVGNLYLTGVFGDTADFDPGPGVYNLISRGGQEMFISSLDSSGNFRWAGSIGGIDHDIGRDVFLNSSGELLITGDFTDTTDFDIGPDTFNLISEGNTDAFILKLDTLGNFIMALAFSGTSGNNGSAICTDSQGNIYTTGSIRGTADLDPGPGTYELTSPVFPDPTIFVSKLSSTGSFIWAFILGEPFVSGTNISADEQNNIYISGPFTNTVDFDPGSGIYNVTAAGAIDTYIAKFDAQGSLAWAVSMGGTESEMPLDHAVDASGNVYQGGYFSGTADFDPGPADFSLTSAGEDDAYIWVIDKNGDFVWAAQMGGGGTDLVGGVAVDAAGSIYTVGGFSDTADLNPGFNNTDLISNGSWDIFIQKLYISSILGLDSTYCIPQGAITLSGSPEGGVFGGPGVIGNQFDPTVLGAGTYTVTYVYTDSNSNVTVTSQEVTITICLGIQDHSLQSRLNVYPNPSSGGFNLSFKTSSGERFRIRILDNLGREVYLENTDNANDFYFRNLDLSGKGTGSYHVQVIFDDHILSRRLIIE